MRLVYLFEASPAPAPAPTSKKGGITGKSLITKIDMDISKVSKGSIRYYDPSNKKTKPDFFYVRYGPKHPNPDAGAASASKRGNILGAYKISLNKLGEKGVITYGQLMSKIKSGEFDRKISLVREDYYPVLQWNKNVKSGKIKLNKGDLIKVYRGTDFSYQKHGEKGQVGDGYEEKQQAQELQHQQKYAQGGIHGAEGSSQQETGSVQKAFRDLFGFFIRRRTEKSKYPKDAKSVENAYQSLQKIYMSLRQWQTMEQSAVNTFNQLKSSNASDSRLNSVQENWAERRRKYIELVGNPLVDLSKIKFTPETQKEFPKNGLYATIYKSVVEMIRSMPNLRSNDKVIKLLGTIAKPPP